MPDADSPSPTYSPNKGLELTASSVRSCLAPATSRSSGLAVERRTMLRSERTYGSLDGRRRSFALGVAHSMNDLDVGGDALA